MRGASYNNQFGAPFGRASAPSFPSYNALTLTKTPTEFWGARRLSGYAGKGGSKDGVDWDFVGNHFYPTSDGELTALYGQVGGVNIAPTSSLTHPQIRTSQIGLVQGQYGFIHDGGNNVTQRVRDLVTTSGIALPVKDHTIIVVMQNTVSNAASGIGAIPNADGVSADLIEWKVLQGLALKGANAGTNGTESTYPPVNPAVFVLSSDTGGFFRYSLIRVPTARANTAATAATGAGIKIGNVTTANHHMTGKVLAVAVYTPALTAAEIATAVGEFNAAFSLQTSYDAMMIFHGDSREEGSLGSGTEALLGENISTQIQRVVKRPVLMFNDGNVGNTAQAVASSGTAVFVPHDGWVLTGSAYKLGFNGLGINDCIGSRTSVQIIADWQTWANAGVTKGCTSLFIETIAPATSVSGAKETERVNANSALMSGSVTGLAGVVDVASVLTDATNSDYLDGLHWSKQGMGKVAQMRAATAAPFY